MLLSMLFWPGSMFLVPSIIVDSQPDAKSNCGEGMSSGLISVAIGEKHSADVDMLNPSLVEDCRYGDERDVSGLSAFTGVKV